MLFVTGQRKSDRLAVCGLCEHYRHDTKSCGPLVKGKTIVVDGKKVKLCGCVMPVKAALKVGSCPLDRWEHQLNEEDLRQMRQFVETLPNTINASEQVALLLHYNKITGEQRKSIGSCSACARKLIRTIREFVESSEIRLADSSK